MRSTQNSKDSPVKCYDITKCSDADRAACSVWTTFRNNPEDMDGLRCWVIKGIDREENKAQAQKCRKCRYYLLLNQESGVVTDGNAKIATVSCTGAINQEKAAALEKVWASLKKSKNLVLLDISKVNNLYTAGLSMLVKMHVETKAAGGMLVVAGSHGVVQEIIAANKMTRIFHFAPDMTTAEQLFDAFARKKDEEVRAAVAAAQPKPAPRPVEAEKPLRKPLKKFIPCHEYWKNRNPRNATNCDECSNKKKPTSRPCWMVENVVEGITFTYVNESCIDCAYYEEFGQSAQGQSLT
ncbi:MAG: STAS domain-containing protein [Chitinispirillaceae bacterium]|jgi:anti-anti-sigma factor|nr:STAS domain-containing protein [Chitinispirillaceae bacterium]